MNTGLQGADTDLCRKLRSGHAAVPRGSLQPHTPVPHVDHRRTCTLLLEVPLEEPPPLPTREAGSSGGLEPGAGPTGLDRWLGFCSDNPAAFFL